MQFSLLVLRSRALTVTFTCSFFYIMCDLMSFEVYIMQVRMMMFQTLLTILSRKRGLILPSKVWIKVTNQKLFQMHFVNTMSIEYHTLIKVNQAGKTLSLYIHGYILDSFLFSCKSSSNVRQSVRLSSPLFELIKILKSK